MKKYILSLFVAVTIACISSSTAATASTANYVGIFGTNSSQTNFTIPAGDSIYIAHWLNQTDGDGNPGYASASISSITKTVTNSIVYVAGKPKIVTVTNSITNSCNFLLNDPANTGIVNEGILVPGPATISTTSTAFQYKYFPKKSPYQVLLIQTGTTNPTSITIPAGQKLHQISIINYDLNYGNNAIGAVTMNGFGNVLNGGPDIGLPLYISDVYGPATLSFMPADMGDGTGSPGNFYFSYILINSDATNIPITTP